ncbi:hypothetical protein QO010_003366 [Caulobacter ginsengisoli]|uniref:DUF6035 domain-containing protein n=1 Tax=Caulobacter ginsengisoli TaxID=400775 RepID=A0ABU0IU93_9CAUL|nr:DUF6035 family protein [Caulobacter ginsengisoli]MDQ0465577.1 hypothetical protein [Caulobacter ginsengisoli]
MRKPQRTIQRAIDLSTSKVITSDDLLLVDADRYQEIRRGAVTARREGGAAFACDLCGHAVYAPREPTTRLPFWRHHKGAPQACPWWTGDPATIDQNSANQFQGAQESPLHLWLKHQVGDGLRRDPLTASGSVIIDEYLSSAAGTRRPDVRAVHDGRNIAFEIQLSSTQLPIIDAREHFYQREGFHLIWLAWNFVPVERRKLITAFEDIFYSHSKNLLTLDDETLARSAQEGRFLLKAYWEKDGWWASGVFGLSELTWPATGLPYAVEPPLPWHLDFRSRWLAEAVEYGPSWEANRAFMAEIIARLGLQPATVDEMIEADIRALLNTLLSLIEGRPIASRQTNLVEKLHTFFNGPVRLPYARIVRTAAIRTGHQDLMERPTTRQKYADAIRNVNQCDRGTIPGQIAIALFPDVFGE